MINKAILQNSLFFDIETVPSYPSLDDLLKEDYHLFKLWNKRCKWLAKNVDPEEDSSPSVLWENRASLHPEFGKIVCVSLGTYTEHGIERIMSFYGDDEKDILEKTNKVFRNANVKGMKIAGQNIKNFDIPYLGKRMLINRITPAQNIQTWNKKPWETSFLDLAEVFAFGAWGQGFSSLDLISHVLGVKGSKDNLDGSLVAQTYWTDKDIEKIKEYCEEDVLCTMQCFDRISI